MGLFSHFFSPFPRFFLFFLGFFPNFFLMVFSKFSHFLRVFAAFSAGFAPPPPGANTAALPGIAGGVPTKRPTGQGTNDAGGRRPAAWRG